VPIADIATLRTLFLDARSHNGWGSEPINDTLLEQAYEIAKWGPTSMNTQPMRLVFLRSPDAKNRLKPALAPGNIDKALSAAVVAIVAHDLEFYSHLPTMFPHNPNAQNMFVGNEGLIQGTAFRNATLQGAYFMIALRAVGLDVGPMSGFDASKVDAEFFAGTSYRANFLCGIGRGNPEKLFKRSPRFAFSDVSQTL
jgi:3-hydroxypropanoate dehydrogenase